MFLPPDLRFSFATHLLLAAGDTEEDWVMDLLSVKS